VYAARPNGIKMRMVGTLALNLAFSPSPRCRAVAAGRRRNCRWPSRVLRMAVRQIQPHEFVCDGERFSFSFGEKAGMRESVSQTDSSKMVCWLALILTFSPGEKEQPLCVSGHADGRPANPMAAIQVRRRTGERTRGASGRESIGKGNAGAGQTWVGCFVRNARSPYRGVLLN
jgi:hypothetical protein